MQVYLLYRAIDEPNGSEGDEKVIGAFATYALARRRMSVERAKVPGCPVWFFRIGSQKVQET